MPKIVLNLDKLLNVMSSYVQRVSMSRFRQLQQSLMSIQGVFESMYKLHHDLGVFSNIIVPTTYEQVDKMP